MSKELETYKELFKKYIDEVNLFVRFLYNSYIFVFKSFFEDGLEPSEDLDRKIKSNIEYVEYESDQFSDKVKKKYRSKVEDIRNYFKNFYESLNDLYYYIVIFSLITEAKPYIIIQREEKEERIVVFKREWVIDDEYTIQEFFCDLSRQLDKNQIRVDYPILLKMLKADFQKFINSKNFFKFLDKLRSEDKREASKILLGQICESLKKLGLLEEKDSEQIQKLIEQYLKVIYNIINTLLILLILEGKNIMQLVKKFSSNCLIKSGY